MCSQVGVNLQRGMNYHLRGNISVILMNLRPNAPYADRVESSGRVLIYEGHDAPKTHTTPNPKGIDQPAASQGGTLTQNGLFLKAAGRFKNGDNPEIVEVYEKLHRGIWVFNGAFMLTDAWQEESGLRKVYKFKLEITEGSAAAISSSAKEDADRNRIIPPRVKLEVWQRDKGRCRVCGATTDLHFDHVIPFSKGGSSMIADNIQILCGRHNLAKGDKIE